LATTVSAPSCWRNVFHGQADFDPTVLTDEFRKICSLADFIGCN
jgi:hypothetical protein